ncbi:MAG TPA: indolepyruvate oxidoreductase subunit beta [Smithella sp.]|jgi:indolepyruvate ferredoxin oxidoreductase beta subunit|nr:indolepyruvate oxidoreductase subunit beta [Smithella sp.]OQC51264.1 MAG: indolepyruvate oxidoreductase subunit beta [Deltaproteobacteria bacterium ADurb.Bin022]HNQ65496.1 indolepyruvate oxidoreductase subunit beta [Smithella sp.]HOE32401.1 indolepyruvate oxidoreductase subunit beta [Smithella sp.]HOG10679.1 indolepyruvate oxidoreductase subunit beta [Smithella sp.]
MSENEVKNILFAGVGGQGILRASDIICEVIMEAGFDVKKSEVHGMAQRGGCVTSHVRYGKKVYSPLAEPGSIQTLVSFEKMESLRYLSFLRKDAAIVVNTEEVYPPAVNMGESPYPDDAVEFLQNNYKTVISFDASKLAQKAGNIKTANVILLGALSNHMNIDKSIWERVIKKSFPEKLIKVNLEAFQMGIHA